jgi:hypothetical protein
MIDWLRWLAVQQSTRPLKSYFGRAFFTLATSCARVCSLNGVRQYHLLAKASRQGQPRSQQKDRGGCSLLYHDAGQRAKEVIGHGKVLTSALDKQDRVHLLPCRPRLSLMRSCGIYGTYAPTRRLEVFRDAH